MAKPTKKKTNKALITLLTSLVIVGGSALGFSTDFIPKPKVLNQIESALGINKKTKTKQIKQDTSRVSSNASSQEEIIKALEDMEKSEIMVVELNGNTPDFSKDDLNLKSNVNKIYRDNFVERQEKLDWFELNMAGFTEDKYTWESLSDLDVLNRVGQANVMLSSKVRPKVDRNSRLTISPSGWKQQKINGSTVYDRSHLIGYRFTGHNDEPRNLMTGTAKFNQQGMKKYEDMLGKVVDTTNTHVRYRVTPIFKNEELVARGVKMEAQSIEDDSLKFNVLVANIKEGYVINYSNGSIREK